jgi:sulfofructose kinase
MSIKKKYDVIGLGSSMVDVLSLVDHFPDKEGVQKAYLSCMEGGGPVATAIVTLARLGAQTAMIDSLGNDWLGNFILGEFGRENVDASLLKIHEGETSSLSNILVRKTDGTRTIVYSRGSAPEINPAEISIDTINQAKFIHISGRHFETCLNLARNVNKQETKISFDGGANRFKERDKQLIPLVDICIVAKEYALSYIKESDVNSTGNALLTEGPEIVVITDGINGSWLFTREINSYHQPAFIMKDTIDTTGCGDSFHGAFLFGLCKGFNLYETMRFASAVAALNSLKLGGRSGLPNYDEAKDFLERIQ